MKNLKVRVAMMEAGVSQKELARMLGTTQPVLCTILRSFELANSEKASIIAKIKEHAQIAERG